MIATVMEACNHWQMGEPTIIHGAAKGADSIAGRLAEKNKDFEVEAFPADWKQYGKAAGPIRNKQMLDSGLDLVFAFHNDLSKSKGTKHMVEICRKAGIPVGVFSE